MISTNKKAMLAAMSVCSVLLLSACTNNSVAPNSNTGAVQENSQNQSGQNQNSTNPDNSSNSDGTAASEQLVNEFQSLLGQEGKLPAAFDFLDKHADQLKPEHVSQMLLALEDAQIEGLQSLLDRYFSGNNQEQIAGIYEIGDSLEELINKAKDADLKALLQETLDSGYQLNTAEGMFGPELDYRRTAQYSDIATEDTAAYLKLKSAESEQASQRDAALVIPWEELLKRAIAAEDFLNNYPDSSSKEDVAAMFSNYKNTVFLGANNTPLFAYENKVMDEEARKAYTDAVSGDAAVEGTLLGDLKKFMDEAAKANYKLTDSLEQFRDQLIK